MSHVLSLSQGSLEVLLSGGSFENPIVQILDHNVTHDNDGYEKFKLNVSDGKHSHHFHMLKTPENAKLMQELSKYSVVRIQKFILLMKTINTSQKFDKVILSMEMVMDGKHICKELGKPQIWREKFDDICLDSTKPTSVFPPSDCISQINIPIAQPSISNSQQTTPVAQPTTLIAEPTTPTTPTAQPTTPKSQPNTPKSQPTTPKSQPSILLSQHTTPVSSVFSSKHATPSSHMTTPSSHTTTPDTPTSTCQPTTPSSKPTTPFTISSSTAHSSKIITAARKALFERTTSEVKRTCINKIAELQYCNNSWQIKACVRNKSDILKSKNNKYWFSMQLFDNSGEIRAIAFGDFCEKFHSMFQNNKLYLISGGQLKEELPQYRTNNMWQIIFNMNTKVQECMEDEDFMSHTKFDNFIPIHEINSKPDNSFINVIGVCKSATNVQNKLIKDKLAKIRRITLADNSSSEDFPNQIVLTLWDNEAEKFDATGHPVIAVKSARVAQFQGIKELTYYRSRTSLHMNPDIPEALLLRRWYDDIANNEVDNNDSIKWITFSEAEARRRLGSANEFSILGVVTCPISENVVYKACPENSCNKKLVVLENGRFKCEKCNKECTNYKYSMRLSAVVSDPTGDQTITAFNSCAEVMLGKNTAEISRLFEHDKINYTQTFEELKFKIFLFKICTKMETFENVSRLNYVAIHVQPFDSNVINRRLISDIKSITGKAI